MDQPQLPAYAHTVRAPRRCASTALAWGIVLTGWCLQAPGLARAGEAAPSTQPLAEGRRIFEEKQCLVCHGSPGDPQATRSAPDLGRQSWQNVLQLAGSFWNHAPAMSAQMHARGIARPALSPDEIRQLVTYLFCLRFLDEPGDPAKGAELFAQHSCAECHQLAGRGGTVGPRLDELKGHATPLFVAQAFWNHGAGMAAKMDEMKIARPVLAGDDVADLVAFLRGDGSSAAAAELASAEAASPRTGNVLFHQRGCIKCHAIDGDGGTIGPDLGSKSPARSVSRMAGSLWNHGPLMRAKMQELHVPMPRLTDRDLADLFSYLYFVHYMTTGGEAAKGREVFQAKACARCHDGGGSGPQAGPNLAASASLRSPIDWASAMWNHAPGMEKALPALQIEWPRFDGDEMADLVVFLRLQRGQ